MSKDERNKQIHYQGLFTIEIIGSPEIPFRYFVFIFLLICARVRADQTRQTQHILKYCGTPNLKHTLATILTRLLSSSVIGYDRQW